MATSKTHNDPQDAIAILTADHRKVHALFEQFSTMKEKGSDQDKAAIVEQVCNELTIHTALEEEIFYPAVRKAIDDADLMDEALVEHAGAKQLIEQLLSMDPSDELYDAKVTVLGEQIDHHVEEEEDDMFVQAKKSKVDTSALGAKMLKKRMALLGELGIENEDGEEVPVKKKASGRR